MRNITLTLFATSLLAWSLPVRAQEAGPEIEPTPWYENNDQVPYPNNTGPLGVLDSDTSADIVSESGESNNQMAGALEGEITLKKRADIVEVYSNGNLVEGLVKGSGGTGMVVSESTSVIVFKPAGRPDLNCPAQDIADWFGPCKVEEAQES